MGQGPGQSHYAAPALVGIAAIFIVLLFGFVPVSSQTNTAKQHAPAGTARPDIIFVQTAVFVPGPLAQRFPQGSRIVRLSSSSGPGELVHLTGEFFAAADPQLNFDATRILFSGQKTKDHRWQLWEMDLDGTHKRQMTECSEDCLRGAYLPANEIAFTVETTNPGGSSSHLAVIKNDGSDLHPITFGGAPFQLETVLRDGRIVASAPWPLRASQDDSGARLLYTLRPDGTALESFRCAHGDKAIQADAEELADGSVVFVRRAILGSYPAGTLAQVQRGALVAMPLGPLRAIYQSPRQLSETELIIAKQNLTAANSPGRFDLYVLNVLSGALGPRVYADAKLSSIQPAPVVAHAVPKHYWNTLNPDSSTGNLISLDSYLSADATHGRITTPISRVRVFALDTTDGQERNLGEAPVESDGSFFIKVPANTPVRFVLLDANGQTIREERSWVWARPGEQRGCTGCHGDKAVAPDNHWPQTLRRFDTPTPLGDTDHGSTAQAK